MTRNIVWEEIRKTASYIYGIEKYTKAKRKYNTGSKLFTFIIAIVCVITTIYPEWREATIITSIIVATCTFIKEFKPIYAQPEEELRELDNICDFYKGYLNKLEDFFTSNCYDSIDSLDDKKKEEFKKIINTVGDRETTMKRLCRSSYWESKEARQKTSYHLKNGFPQAENYLLRCD